MSFVTFLLGIVVGALAWDRFGTKIKAFIQEKKG